MLSVATVPPSTLMGFKALPGWEAGALGSVAGSEAEWSGLYPQLSLRDAVHYLPNQWDRGATRAQIVALWSSVALQVLVCRDPYFVTAHVGGAAKAKRLCDLLAAELPVYRCPPGTPLVPHLGSQHLLLCLLDAEDYELVVPHALQGSLRAETLFRMEVSTRYPCCTGRVMEVSLPREVLVDPALLGTALCSQGTLHACDDLRKILGV